LNEVIKKLEHVRELWDKLDPRDRDVILHNADFKVDTLSDWKALSRDEKEMVFRWLYV
jgi:hypothetical protein